MSGEVLSQNEIDALLSALSKGEMNADELKKEESAKKIKTYDFKRALRYSKDQIRSLTRIHENFARLLTTFFSAKLRTHVQITVGSTDQIPYEEFIRSIPQMTILTVFEVQPLDGRLIIEINPNIAYSMLDRVLGGRGESINKVERLTEIETKIMSQLFENAVGNLTEAWSAVAEIEPTLAEFEVNPQFLQMVSPNDTVVVISLNTHIGEASGMINICIPHVVLEPIMPKLSVHYWMQTKNREREPKEIAILESRIRTASLPIVAQLGESEISIHEFLQLGLGDVIQLNQGIDKPILVSVGNEPKFYGQPGKANKKIAIQIIEQIKGGDSDYE